MLKTGNHYSRRQIHDLLGEGFKAIYLIKTVRLYVDVLEKT
jgi:hypothetical protein